MKYRFKFLFHAGLAALLLFTLACHSDSSDQAFGTAAAGELEEGITLAADPNVITLDPNDPEAPKDPDTGKLLGKAALAAVLIDDEGNPVVGAEVTFSTSAGLLESEGNPVTTGDQGIALDTLAVTEDDAGEVEVTAESGDFTDTLIIPVVVLALNEPPTADAGDDQTLECPGPVTRDGSGSSDPNDDIVSFEWFIGEEMIADTETAEVELPVGVTVVTLVVTDATDLSDSDEVTITVEDTTQPAINCPANTPQLCWWSRHCRGSPATATSGPAT